MTINSYRDYQKVLSLAEELLSKNAGDLTLEEKQKLTELMKAIRSWQFEVDAIPVIAAIS